MEVDIMKKLDDFLNDYKDYKKIMHTGGSLIRCTLYNPNTKKVVDFIVDDYEYDYGDGLVNRDYDLETLEYIRYNMQIDSEALKHYKKHVLKEITEGSKVEVIKGKKYPIGLRGTVKKIYTYIVPNTYNKVRVQYAILETGEKINIDNIKLIEC
jgi:hypothetical protein